MCLFTSNLCLWNVSRSCIGYHGYGGRTLMPTFFVSRQWPPLWGDKVFMRWLGESCHLARHLAVCTISLVPLGLKTHQTHQQAQVDLNCDFVYSPTVSTWQWHTCQYAFKWLTMEAVHVLVDEPTLLSIHGLVDEPTLLSIHVLV